MKFILGKLLVRHLKNKNIIVIFIKKIIID